MSSAPWRVLILLSISAFLNYFDRANLSAGATDIQNELGLTNSQLGLLLSAFFWTYALAQLLSLSGWLADRFNASLVLAAGFFLWSGATATTGVARGFAMVFTLRLVLGMGESIAYPCYSRIIANAFPEHHRGFANAAIDASTKLGPALGTLIGGLLIHVYGWRPFFIVLGIVSLLWLGPWLFAMPRGHAVSKREHPSGIPSIGAILRQRSALFSALGLFCTNYFWYFLLTWLPHYLESARHFSKDKMAYVACGAYFAIAASALISGYASDRCIVRGLSTNRVRKTFCGVGLSLASVIVGVAFIQNDTLAMALLMFSCISFGLFSSNVYAITQTLAGPRASGKWTSFQNGFANLAGVAAPWLTGWIVDKTGQYALAFGLAALIVFAGAAIFVWGIERVEPVDWKLTSAS
jgi:MFS family permease